MGEDASKADMAAVASTAPDWVAPGSRKRERADSEGSAGGDLKRVAEIVMVLSAMGQMRGGRDPTPAEKGLAAEAREKLVAMCQSLRPNDLFTSDAARIVAGDLGFNPAKDQMGNRPIRKVSIAEKVVYTKKKMEESKDVMVPSSQYPSSYLPGVAGMKPNNHTATYHGGHRLFPDKPNQISSSAAGIQPGSPLVHSSTQPSATSFKQTTFHEIKQPGTPFKSPGAPIDRDLTSSTPSAHFRVDGHPGGPPYTSQVQVTSPSNRFLEKSPSTSTLPSASSAATKPTQVIKSMDHIPMNIEGPNLVGSFQTVPQMINGQNVKSSSGQVVQGSVYNAEHHYHVVNPLPASVTNNIEIAKIVQKFLQPKAADLTGWTPPSVDYMTKPLSCQFCKINITDLESLLVCDACERGVHLKCLKSFNQRAASNLEWHCPKCLQLSHGKPLPPKYGKVTRNIAAPKASLNASAQIPSEKRTEIPDPKTSHQRMRAGSSHPIHASAVTSDRLEATPDAKMLSAREHQNTDTSISGAEEENLLPKTICTDHTKEKGDPTDNSSGTTNEGCSQCKINGGLLSCNMKKSTPPAAALEPNTELNPTLVKEPVTGLNACDQSQTTSSVHIANEDKVPPNSVDSSNSHHENSIRTDGDVKQLPDIPETSNQNDSIGNGQQIVVKTSSEIETMGKIDQQEIGGKTPTVILYSSDGARDCKLPPSSDLHGLEWIGDVLQTIDGKSYYQSCRINNVIYDLQDHVLLSSEIHNISPSKLQALWENESDGSKWAVVNRYYFSTDIQEGVTRPSTPENNEVYESNDTSTIEASRIHGRCVVVPPMMFKEESEKQAHLAERNNVLCPVFLCRWFYDKSKTVFQPVSS